MVKKLHSDDASEVVIVLELGKHVCHDALLGEREVGRIHEIKHYGEGIGQDESHTCGDVPCLACLFVERQ